MDRLYRMRFHGVMTNTILITGATGKTGRRLSSLLRRNTTTVRRAARHGADLGFDWDQPATYDAALADVDAVYLVQPTLRFDHAPLVSHFLDRAERAGVRHVTLLSARGVDHAPAEVPMRAIELDLAGRSGLSHAILRPGWFLQDFSEWLWHPSIVERGIIATPAGDGAEAFVDADDIAAVALATLVDAGHAGPEYELTGPAAITFDEVARAISFAAGRPVRHEVVSTGEWAASATALGLPADYAAMLASLLAGIADGTGETTTPDVERVLGRPARSVDDFLGAVDPVIWQSVA
jgi:uncharacterized protein YbjT (DUF2867 family)